MATQNTNSGEALRTLRVIAGLSLKEVAEGADTSIAYLSKVERNQLLPSQEYIAKVTLYLGGSMLGKAA